MAELTFEDLWTACEVCGGAGHRIEHSFTGNTLGVTSTRTSGPCADCKGEGGKMTKAGEAIAKFIAKIRR